MKEEELQVIWLNWNFFHLIILLIGIFVILILFFKRLPKKDQLNCETISSSKLSQNQIIEIWELFNVFFEEEFDSFQDFKAYLISSNYSLFLHNHFRK
jgi:hypothetical protein